MHEETRALLNESLTHHEGAIGNQDWEHLLGNVLGAISSRMRDGLLPIEDGDEVADTFSMITGHRVYFATENGAEFYEPLPRE